MEDASFLRMNLKMTSKWAWPRSPDPISKFWDPYNSNWQKIKGKLQVYYNNKTANIKGKN